MCWAKHNKYVHILIKFNAPLLLDKNTGLLWDTNECSREVFRNQLMDEHKHFKQLTNKI